MAIQPIDLQTLYTQLDKIGKSQVQQQVASQVAREAEMANNRKEAADRLTTVQGTETSDDKTGKVHERTEGETRDGEKGDRRDQAPQRDDSEPAPAPEVIKDPALGTHVDISG